MSKFFVVYGYCGPDHYTDDSGPVLEVKEFNTAEQVEKFYQAWMYGTDDDEDGLAHNEDVSQVTFRVFEGKELFLKPVETVTKFKLE